MGLKCNEPRIARIVQGDANFVKSGWKKCNRVRETTTPLNRITSVSESAKNASCTYKNGGFLKFCKTLI